MTYCRTDECPPLVVVPPPSDEWMTAAIEVINKYSGHSIKLTGRREKVKQLHCPEIHPHIRDSIVGDGACLFRAFSKFVTGKQSNHQALRMAVVNFMTHPDNVLKCANAIFHKMHYTPEEALTTVHQYLRRSKMKASEAWGTDKEIRVAATMLQIDINVFCQYGSQRKWTSMYPDFTSSTCLTPHDTVKMYLYHLIDHYDLVIPHVD